MKHLSVLLLLMVLGCSTSDDDLASLSDLYIPPFSNAWTVEKGTATGLFFINSSQIDSTKATGKLEAFEQASGFSYELKGSFEKVNVNLQYLTNAEFGDDNGPRAGFAYKGKYDTLSKPYAIRLVNIANAADSLVLRRS